MICRIASGIASASKFDKNADSASPGATRRKSGESSTWPSALLRRNPRHAEAPPASEAAAGFCAKPEVVFILLKALFQG